MLVKAGVVRRHATCLCLRLRSIEGRCASTDRSDAIAGLSLSPGLWGGGTGRAVRGQFKEVRDAKCGKGRVGGQAQIGGEGSKGRG